MSMMRRHVLVVVAAAVWLSAAAPALALESNSFRLRGLGTGLSWIVDDPLSDMFQNPARLFSLEGVHLFTNLSNLQDQGDERFFDGRGGQRVNLLGSLLLGATVTRPAGLPFGAGLFVEYQDTAFRGDLIDLDDDQYTYAGDFYSYDEYYYDTLEVSLRDVAVALPVAVQLGDDTTVGLLLSYEEFSGALALEDSSIEDYHVDFWDQPWNRRREWVDRDEYRMSGSSGFGVLAGVMQKFDSWNLEAVAGYRPVRIPIGLPDIDPLFGGTVMGVSVDSIASYLDPGGLDIYAPAWQARLKISAELGDGLALHGIAGFRLMEFASKVTIEESDSFDVLFEPEGVAYHRDTTNTETYEVSGLVSQVPVTLGLTWQFKDWGLLALGVNGHLFRVDAQYASHPEVEVSNYRFEGNAPDHAYVTEVFSTDNDYTLLEGDMWLGLVSVPVGIEMNLAQWLALRLGAETFLPVWASGEMSGHEVDEPDYMAVTTSDGKVAQWDQDSTVHKEAKEASTDEVRSTVTVYNAGLGFKVNENIGIDALSFANVTNLEYWKISLAFSYHY